MLYLEDYLESKYDLFWIGVYAVIFHAQQKTVAPNLNFPSFVVIEHLPQELRDRFTDMREMDLSIHSKSHKPSTPRKKKMTTFR